MATIIKSFSNREKSSGTTVQPVAFSFADMSHRADEYLDTVRERAAEIVAEAHEKAETIRRRSEQAGRQAAEEAIEEVLAQRVAAQLESLRPAIEQVVADLDDARGAWQEHWNRTAVKLAVAIAERIVRREIQERPEITLDFAREALEMAVGSSDVVVHLNPEDHKHLGEQAEALAESINRLAPTRFVADPEITAGGCRVETRFGEIDQQIEAQLARIADELC